MRADLEAFFQRAAAASDARRHRPGATSRSRSWAPLPCRSCSPSACRTCTTTPSWPWRASAPHRNCRFVLSSRHVDTSSRTWPPSTRRASFTALWWGDDELAKSLVRRAEAAAGRCWRAGRRWLGWRPRDLRNAHLPFLEGKGLAQFFSDPLFSNGSRRGRRHAPPPRSRRSSPPEPGAHIEGLRGDCAPGRRSRCW